MTTYAQSTFTAANSTSLDAITPETGPAWAEQVGAWDIQSNKASLASFGGDGQNVATVDPGVVDHPIKADITTPGAGDIEAGIVFNWQDSNNYWMFVHSTFLGNNVAFYERSGGTFTLRAESVDAFVFNGGTYELQVVTRGDSVVGIVDGVPVLRYTVSSRPLKTQTKCGFRIFNNGGGDAGSKFDNFVVASAAAVPADLTYGQLGSAQTLIDAFSDNFLELSDDFASNTIANYTELSFSGATTAAISGGTFNLSGAGAGKSVWRHTGTTCLAPYMFAEAEVTATSSALPIVGFAKDANNYVVAYIENGDPKLDCKNNSVQTTASDAQAFTPTYKVLLAFSYPEMWVWIDTGSGYVPYAKQTIDTGVDLRLLANFQTGWKPCFGADRSAGGTCSITKVRFGYLGGIGVRDYKPVTEADGTPYIVAGKAYFLMTCATGDSFLTNHAGIMSVDLSTGDAELVTQLFYNIADSDRDNPAAAKDMCVGLYGGQMIRNQADDGWEIYTNGWGRFASNTLVHEFYVESSADLLGGGVFDLDAYELDIGEPGGAYDGSVRWDGSTLKMAVSTTTGGSPDVITSYAEGTTPDNLTIVRNDNTVQAEQQNWMKFGEDWYISAGGTDGPHYWNDDLTSNLGDLLAGVDPAVMTAEGITYSGFGSGYCVIPFSVTASWGDGTRYLLLLFTNDLYLTSAATKGQFVAMISDQDVPEAATALSKLVAHSFAIMRAANY
jgi:hypothetical protein